MYRLSDPPKVFRDDFANGFAILDAARALGEAFMIATGSIPVTRPIDVVLRTLFTRMYNLSGAATILAEEGYGIEEGALTRGLMEHYFDIAYIAHQSNTAEEADDLARRFINHQYVARFLNIKNAKEAGMSLRPREYQNAEEDRKEHWDSIYG